MFIIYAKVFNVWRPCVYETFIEMDIVAEIFTEFRIDFYIVY